MDAYIPRTPARGNTHWGYAPRTVRMRGARLRTDAHGMQPVGFGER